VVDISAPPVRNGNLFLLFWILILTRFLYANRDSLRSKTLCRPKRKGLQLALEPLNGQGIAGYVPEP
jgi:hypothetical protein